VGVIVARKGVTARAVAPFLVSSRIRASELQPARSAGRRSGDAVSHRVARSNAEGTAARAPRHGGRRRPTNGPEARSRIAAVAARAPTPEADGTATCSSSALRRAPRASGPGGPGRPVRVDYEYVREGTCTIWMFVEPPGGWRDVRVTEAKTAVDWAEQVRLPVDDPRYAEVERITLVCDNLNTHGLASLSKAFRARRGLADRPAIGVGPHAEARESVERGGVGVERIDSPMPEPSDRGVR
jgi:hypothetical protein